MDWDNLAKSVFTYLGYAAQADKLVSVCKSYLWPKLQAVMAYAVDHDDATESDLVTVAEATEPWAAVEAAGKVEIAEAKAMSTAT